MALMVGAMTIHGIVPGPQVMTKQPELFWGMIASMWLGNLMLVIINLPLVGVWVTLLRVPYRLLYPSIIVFCCIGIYSINNSPTDVVIAAIFGLVRLLADQARVRTGTAGACLRPGSADGRESAPRHANRARRRHRVRHAADLGRASRGRVVPAGARRSSDDPQTTRRSVRRITSNCCRRRASPVAQFYQPARAPLTASNPAASMMS